MASDRLSTAALERELSALRARVSDLADTVTTMSARGAEKGRETAYHTGREVARLSGEAGDLAKRYPATTGLTLLAVAGAVLCFMFFNDRQISGRRR